MALIHIKEALLQNLKDLASSSDYAKSQLEDVINTLEAEKKDGDGGGSNGYTCRKCETSITATEALTDYGEGYCSDCYREHETEIGLERAQRQQANSFANHFSNNGRFRF